MLQETDVDLEYDNTPGHLDVLTKEGPCWDFQSRSLAWHLSSFSGFVGHE